MISNHSQITGVTYLYLSDQHTCSKPPPYSHTLGAALCRHSVVVVNVCSKLLREGDVGHSTPGGGGIPVVQVDVGWVCTILDGAVVHWLI